MVNLISLLSDSPATHSPYAESQQESVPFCGGRGADSSSNKANALLTEAPGSISGTSSMYSLTKLSRSFDSHCQSGKTIVV